MTKKGFTYALQNKALPTYLKALLAWDHVDEIFSWCTIAKLEKMHPMNTRYTKWS
jgi:hypothetical protein